MKKVSVALLMLCFVFSNVLGQTAMPIYDINREAMLQTLGDSSFTNSIWIRTSGVVTHVMNNGYYLQDAMGDDDLSTNDALFVRTDSVPSNVFTGNALTVRGLWYHDGNQTVLLPDSSHRLDQQMVTLNATSVTFPDDFTDYSQYVGMLLHFDQTLVVTSNYNWKRYGQLTLSSKRLITPTQAALPGSSDYRAIVTSNNKDQLIMDDGSDTSYPSPLPFADANGTRRTGSKITDLTAVMRYSSFGYNVVPNVTPTFWGNARPDSVVNLGDYNLKVCAFNLQYYLSSNYGTGYGPDNAADAQKQHAKILAACLALDCDIYGLVEVQTGQGAISQLCMALNSATGTKNYAYVNDGTSTNGSYTKVGYIYRQDKVEAVGQIQSLNTVVSNRKKAQAFKLKSNGEQFIYGLVHYKSKSGT